MPSCPPPHSKRERLIIDVINDLTQKVTYTALLPKRSACWMLNSHFSISLPQFVLYSTNSFSYSISIWIVHLISDAKGCRKLSSWSCWATRKGEAFEIRCSWWDGSQDPFNSAASQQYAAKRAGPAICPMRWTCLKMGLLALNLCRTRKSAVQLLFNCCEHGSSGRSWLWKPRSRCTKKPQNATECCGIYFIWPAWCSYR